MGGWGMSSPSGVGLMSHINRWMVKFRILAKSMGTIYFAAKML